MLDERVRGDSCWIVSGEGGGRVTKREGDNYIDRETDRKTGRTTETETERERDRDRDRELDTERERKRERESESECVRERAR